MLCAHRACGLYGVFVYRNVIKAHKIEMQYNQSKERKNGVHTKFVVFVFIKLKSTV